MYPVTVAGLGPGNISLTTKEAVACIQESDIVAGGKRNLESVHLLLGKARREKQYYTITADLAAMIEYINLAMDRSRVTVVTSGDPCFYSILPFLQNNINGNTVRVIPGISSAQYMFSAIGKGYEDAFLGSLHGRDDDIVERVRLYSTVFYLLDRLTSCKELAQTLTAHGMGERMMYIGCRLSYDDEEIHRGRAETFIDREVDTTLSVVVISNEE